MCRLWRGYKFLPDPAGLCRNSLAIAETKPANASVVIYRNQAADLELTSEDVSSVDFSAAGGLVVTGTACLESHQRLLSARPFPQPDRPAVQ